jgi:F-type H+-transporting ATPase subunit gamma
LLILFCAEQGFAGAFTEHVLDFARGELAKSKIYLIGSRGGAIASERGFAPGWKTSMPSHSSGVAKLADRIGEALFADIADGEIDRAEIVFNQWRPAQGVHVERRRLFPLDLALFKTASEAPAPLAYLKPETLLAELTFAYMHAQLCNAALHAFAAENEARMEAMARAHGEVERNLNSLLSVQRIVRQEEITAEIVELSAGVAASR